VSNVSCSARTVISPVFVLNNRPSTPTKSPRSSSDRTSYARGAEVVDLEVELDLPRLVGEVREGGLAVGSQGDQAPRQAMPRRVFVAPVRRDRVACRARAVQTDTRRNDAALHELLQLVAPGGLYEARHAALCPKRRRNSSMKGSRSRPSPYDVGHLQLGAVIVDHRVRLEHVERI